MSALSELNQQIANCFKCEIAKQRTRAVPGEGAENAEIMFIGEAPGFNEDQQGRPFVGQAGMYLDTLIALIGMKREQVYITNVIKTRPPGNREPLPQEILNCQPWLDRQMEIIRPKIIVTLGRYSMEKFFPGKSISKIHGQPAKRDGIIYFPMYHPAAALRQFSLRREMEEDIKKLPTLLAQAQSLPEVKVKAEPEPKQMSMF